MLVPAPLVVPADTGVARAPAVRTCRADTAPAARVPVYVRVRIVNAADTVAAASLLLIAQAVATRVRTALSGSPDSVPRGDSLYKPPRDSTKPGAPGRGDSTGLRVVARRDGTLRWSPVASFATPATAVLDRALAEARQASETFIPPETFTADTLPFTLDFDMKFEFVGGRVVPQAAGPITLVAFTRQVAFQVEKQAATVPGTLRAVYPEGARGGGAEGVVILRFVVDTNGQAVDSTIHDVWPKDRPRLTGTLGEHYDRFVRAATEAVRGARFYPAEIGGCPVRQLVTLPITWSLQR